MKYPEKAIIEIEIRCYLRLRVGIGMNSKQTQEILRDDGNVLKLGLWGWFYNSIY